ncbi:hypothetical protein XENTR_v10011211 [Xenopus tropicalis]|nr:hypothetical protein XENTR_v10011211 [Xenopus tropicalis]
MVASWLWGALTTMWALASGLQETDGCSYPLQGARRFTPPRPSECALRCATLTYYRILGQGRRISVLFTEATTSSEQYYCWFLSKQCRNEESLEMAFVVVDPSPLPCQLLIEPQGTGQQKLTPDREVHNLLSSHCGQRFEVTLPFQKAQNAAEFCVRHMCPHQNIDSSSPVKLPRCPPFLITLWRTHIQPGA